MAKVLSGWGSSLANLDVSGDGRVDSADLGMLLSAWGANGGDLNGDGKPEIVAAARQTKNLTIFFNES